MSGSNSKGASNAPFFDYSATNLLMARKEIDGSTLLRIVDERLQDSTWMAQFDKVFGLQEAIALEENKLNAVTV
jgi:hypothetical protein